MGVAEGVEGLVSKQAKIIDELRGRLATIRRVTAKAQITLTTLELLLESYGLTDKKKVSDCIETLKQVVEYVLEESTVGV